MTRVAASGFPVTRHSVVASLGSGEADVRRAAFDAVATAYWKPVFKYVRLKWSAAPDEAADLTQAFFLKAYEKAYFANFDPAKAKFRTYLRTCLDRFVGNTRQENRRQKRGGDVEFVPFDFAAAEFELQPQHVGNAVDELDAFFHREWLHSLFGVAVDRLRSPVAPSAPATAPEFLRCARRTDVRRASRSSNATTWPMRTGSGRHMPRWQTS
jgi:DNA-directed RNA polymerase specialized sigma24 family protein